MIDKVMNAHPKYQRKQGQTKAFTLIELLVVISIIALLAAMVTGMAGLATRKMRDYRVQTEMQKLITAIENYKLQVGYYPPDNPDTNKFKATADQWERLGRNPLFYELSGCIFSNTSPVSGTFRVLAKSETVTPADLKAQLGVDGVVNSARRLRDVPFRQFTFKSSEYKDLDVKGVSVLAVPVPGLPEEMLPDAIGKKVINPWRYDSSSTNRHNPGGFDLSAKYMIGRTNKEVGNWKN